MTTDTTTDPYETNWQVDEMGLMDCGGQVGGDNQATDSWTFRFVQIVEPDDGLHAVVDEYWFGDRLNPEDEDGDPEFGVTGMYMLTVCTDLEDVGGTEVWADVEYDTDADVLVYGSALAAYEAAKRAAEVSMKMPYAWTWDGRAPIR